MWCLPSVVRVSEASSSSDVPPPAATTSLSGGSVSKQKRQNAYEYECHDATRSANAMKFCSKVKHSVMRTTKQESCELEFPNSGYARNIADVPEFGLIGCIRAIRVNFEIQTLVLGQGTFLMG